MDPDIGFQQDFLLFDNLTSFSKAIEAGEGVRFDFASLLELPINSLLSSEGHLILNIKFPDGEGCGDHLLFLTKREAFLFSPKAPAFPISADIDAITSRPFGRSTLLTFFVLQDVLNRYQNQIKQLHLRINDSELDFPVEDVRNLISECKKAEEGLGKFQDFLIKLQETNPQEVETNYLPSEYVHLKNICLSLLDRFHFTYQMLRQLGPTERVQAAALLNRRIEKLITDIKRLVILIFVFAFVILIIGQVSLLLSHFSVINISLIFSATITSICILAGIIAIVLIKKIKFK